MLPHSNGDQDIMSEIEGGESVQEVDEKMLLDVEAVKEDLLVMRQKFQDSFNGEINLIVLKLVGQKTEFQNEEMQKK